MMEEEGTQQSRLFVILAVALIGLLVLGLLGIGGVFVIRQNLREQAALTRATPTVIVRLPVATPTATPIVEAETKVVPTPTNTPVVAPSNSQAAAGGGSGQPESVSDTDGESPQSPPGGGVLNPFSTREAVPGASAAATPNEVPNTGLGALEAILIAFGLVAVLVTARRLRMSTQ